MKKTEYIITEKAGFEVAGGRNPGAGKSLFLSDAQAEHLFRNGEIRRPTKKKKQEAKVEAKSKASEK